jgi:hypothetical protein
MLPIDLSEPSHFSFQTLFILKIGRLIFEYSLTMLVMSILRQATIHSGVGPCGVTIEVSARAVSFP